MSRAIGPRAPFAGGNAASAWTVLLGCWVLVALSWLVWAAARIAGRLSGGTAEPFGIKFVSDVLHGRTGSAWPHTATPAVAAAMAVLAAGAAAATAMAWRVVVARMPPAADPVAALARNPRIRALTAAASCASAARLRPSLAAGRELAPADIGLALGDLRLPAGRGPALYASWEDTVVAFMAPRSGKTTALAVPYVLSAPGPVVATSNKPDLWAATAALRAGTGATVWLFDPQRVTHQPQTWWWNPLRHLATVEQAHRLASHFVITVEDDRKRDLWGPAARRLLAALLLAAASSARTLREVARWLDDTASPTPSGLLEAAGFRALASSLRGTQYGAPDTRDGIYETARTAAQCLTDEQIMTWVTPPAGRGIPVFDPAAFASSRDTLYLLSEDLSAAAPLVAALTDATIRAARRAAERAGGRLDPPLPVILDEAANICRIGDLPQLYSHLGSRGIIPVTILQSYEQGVTVWGEYGMAALWGAATKKLVGAGVDSPRLTRDLALLIGQHDVPVRSASYGDGRAHEQISLRRQDILEPAAIRALPPGSALLLATGAKPALIGLRPWYAGRSAAQITAAVHQAGDAMRRAASQETTSGRPVTGDAGWPEVTTRRTDDYHPSDPAHEKEIGSTPWHL